MPTFNRAIATRAAAAAAAVVVVAVAVMLVTPLHPWASRSSPAATAASSPAGGRATLAPAQSPNPAAFAHVLHVDRNQVVDATGNPVVLHGADISGTETTCAQNWTSDVFGGQPEDDPQTIAAMRSWHLNAVRIPLNEDCWLGINGVRIGRGAYIAPVTRMVRDYEAAGFYVILDLHWSAPGSQRALAQNPAPDADHSPAFWKSVAVAFGGEDKVIFDLFNEPFFYWISSGGPDEWTCLWQGCEMSKYVAAATSYTVDSEWKTAGFSDLVGVIRQTGAKNLILAAGANWARDVSGWLAHRPADANVAASWHAYPSANPALQSECAQAACWNDVVAPLATAVPVIVGETGDSTAGPQKFLPAFLPWADAHHLSYLAWTWNAWHDPDDVLVTDMQTGAPTAGEGAFIRSHLAAETAS